MEIGGDPPRTRKGATQLVLQLWGAGADDTSPRYTVLTRGGTGGEITSAVSCLSPLQSPLVPLVGQSTLDTMSKELRLSRSQGSTPLPRAVQRTVGNACGKNKITCPTASYTLLGCFVRGKGPTHSFFLLEWVKKDSQGTGFLRVGSGFAEFFSPSESITMLDA